MIPRKVNKIVLQIVCFTLIVGGFLVGIITDSIWGWGALGGGLALVFSGALNNTGTNGGDSE